MPTQRRLCLLGLILALLYALHPLAHLSHAHGAALWAVSADSPQEPEHHGHTARDCPVCSRAGVACALSLEARAVLVPSQSDSAGVDSILLPDTARLGLPLSRGPPVRA